MTSKTIWMYWHQGFDQAPLAVMPCVKQWQKLNPSWEIQLLDKHTILDFAEPLPMKKKVLDKMMLPHISDLYRTQLLIKYGGVWADPTTFPLMSLEEWLPQNMNAGFFFFYKPGRDRIISNWFIAAKKQNIMLIRLYDELIKYWNNNNFKNPAEPRTPLKQFLKRLINRNFYLTRLWFTPLFTKILRVSPYMVYHYMFYRLLAKDKKLATLFQKMPKMSKPLMFSFKEDNVYQPLSPEIKSLVDNKSVPLVKLHWRHMKKSISEHTNIGYLFNQTQTLK